MINAKTLARTAAIVPLVAIGALQPAWADDVAFELNNQSDTVMTEFYAVPDGTTADGADDLLLASDILPGEFGSVVIADASPQCHYALTMVFDDGTVQQAALDICQTTSLIVTEPTQDVAFELVNETSALMTEFYAVPDGTTVDGADDLLLASDILPGEFGTVVIADASPQCLYALTMVFDDGTVQQTPLDICTTSSLAIN